MSGMVVWFTGLPASGKSTLAQLTRDRLRGSALPVGVPVGVPVCVLDSDDVRAALSPKPGYSPEEREQFYETLAGLAALLAAQGLIVLVAATANRRKFRARARELAPRFVEVYVATEVQECARRDPKGLYAAARASRLPGGLPGVDETYEPPEHPEVIANGGHDQAALAQIVALVTAPPAPTAQPGG